MAAIHNVMDYYHIPGCAIAIIDKGKSFYFHFGYENIEKHIPFTLETVSGIGSCTKSMTAFAIMRLMDQGILDIDVPIHTYIPGFALYDEKASQMVTIRDMLCHRTGVAGHDGTWPNDSISRKEFVYRLKYMQPNVAFRTLAQYSNVMYVALGGIMEMVTGKTWETILKEEIFDPLEMKHTYCHLSDAYKSGHMAMPHLWDHKLKVISPWKIDMAGPCGSVMSTIQDMCTWVRMHMQNGQWQGKQLLSSSLFRDMHTPQIIMNYPHLKMGTAIGYGLGWRILMYHDTEIQQHTGKIEGYSAFQFYVPKEDSGAVFIDNLHTPSNPFFFTLQGLLLDYFLGIPQQDWLSFYIHRGGKNQEEIYHQLEFNYMPKRCVKETKPSHLLQDYEGIYSNPAYGEFTIRMNKNELELDERCVRHCPMKHFHYDTFSVEKIKEDTNIYTIPLTFLTNTDTGDISGFTLRMEPKVSDIFFHRIK